MARGGVITEIRLKILTPQPLKQEYEAIRTKTVWRAVIRSGYYDNCVRLSGARRIWCHKDVSPGFHRQSQSPRLFVMLCLMASPTNWFAACSQFRPLPIGCMVTALGGLIISRLCSAGCTDFRCGSASWSRSLRRLSTVRPCSWLLGRWLSTGHRRRRARQLRSADTRTLAVNQRTYSSFGDMTFSAAGIKVWNSLPSDLRQSGLLYGQFRRSLKTFLFGQWDCGAVRTLWSLNCAV